jgi:Ferritin-like domain
MKNVTNSNDSASVTENALNRRSFLKYGSASAAMTALVIAGCNDDDNDKVGNVSLGSGDTGILNYAYALEQLEAAFYMQVVSHGAFGSTFSEEERMLLTDIRDHEITHREFFKAALGSDAIPNLEVDFSTINFGNRDSVLKTAKTFEDLGVAAYNGAGKLLTNGDLLLVAGKIVSVEARHAAAIRDLINPLSVDFSGDDVVDNNGFDKALMPDQVLSAAGPFIKTSIDASKLPTS